MPCGRTLSAMSPDERRSAEHLDLTVTGMHCASCVGSVRRAIEEVGGATAADVSLATGRARVHGRVTAAATRAALRDAGYDIASRTIALPAGVRDAVASLPWTLDVRALDDERIEIDVVDSPEAIEALRAVLPDDIAADAAGRAIPAWEREARIARHRAIAAVPLAWLAIGAPPLGRVVPALSHHGIGVPIATALLVLGIGLPFHQRALASVRRRRADMDTLVSLGTLVAFVAGLVEFARGLDLGGHLHAAAMIVTFVTIGRWLEARTRRRLGDAVEGLARLEPDHAELLSEAGVRRVGLHALLPGDRIRVRPGERVPVDGRVLEGRSDLDTSALTGESVLRSVAPGDDALAGSMNGRGALDLEVLRTAGDSTLRRMRAWVQDAESRPAHAARQADGVAAVFVPVVLGLALMTLVGWGVSGGDDGWRRGLVAAVAVLVVACPCALGLATPAAIAAGVGRAARRGVLVRGGDVLERLATIRQVVFDKTGTLTAGKPAIVAWAPWERGAAPGSWQDGSPRADALDRVSRDALAAGAAVELASEHPLAAAVLDAARGAGIEIPTATSVVALPGVGAEGRVDERRVRVGSATALAPDAQGEWLAAADERGHGIVVVEIDRRPALALAWADVARPTSRGAIEAVRARGLEVVMLSGDRLAAARVVGRALGIERVEAPVLPHEKATRVRALEERGGPALMVGDGVNDAPALAAASIGVAVEGATDVAAAAADAAFVGADLSRLPELLDLAHATRRVIAQNLVLAFGYNGAMVPMAAFGHVPPRIAAAAMALSSVSVVGNALRLGRGGGSRR